MKQRRYNGKSSHKRRKLIKSRVEKRELPFELKSIVVNTSSNSIYNDQSVLSTYAWNRISPVANHNLNDKISRKGPPSLKSICAKELARNIDNLDESYLNFASWSNWKTVWNYVLRLNLDTFHAFSMFASIFCDQKDFKSHLSSRMRNEDPIVGLRSSSINSLLIPNSLKHRVENLFSNILFRGLVRYVHGLSYLPNVILDLSNANLNTKDELYMIFNIPNLIALNISNNHLVDDLYLRHLLLSITKEDKLKDLTVLQINNCKNVTRNGLRSILAFTKDDVLSSLSYIESDIYLFNENFINGFQSGNEESEFRYIDQTGWAILDNSSLNSKIMKKSPLGLKLHVLYKHFSNMILGPNSSKSNVLKNQFQNNNRILLDLMVHPNDMTKQIDQDYTSEIIDIWNRRMTRSKDLTNRYCYIIDREKMGNIENKKCRNLLVDNSNQGREQQTKRKRPRMIKKNAEKYFEL